MCPKEPLLRKVLRLISQVDTPYTPLARVIKNITPTMISKFLKTAVGFCGTNVGFEAKDVSARSLRFVIAIALLRSGVDRDIIKLIGRWCINKILRYLYV